MAGIVPPENEFQFRAARRHVGIRSCQRATSRTSPRSYVPVATVVMARLITDTVSPPCANVQ